MSDRRPCNTDVAPRSTPPGSLLDALRERMDRVGPPWGNSKLLASMVEDGYEAGYEVLAIAEALAQRAERAERLNGVLRGAFRRRMREWRERAPEYSYGEEDVEQFLLTAEREADLPTVDDITGITRDV